LLVLLLALADAIHRPLLRAAEPRLAADPAANRRGLARLAQWNHLGDLCAYAGAAALIRTAGPGPAFGLDGLSFLASALLLASLPPWEAAPPAPAPPGGTAPDPRLVRLLTAAAAGAAATAAANLLLAPLARAWHRPSAAVAWLLLALSLGAALGANRLQRWLGPHPPRRLAAGALGGFGLLLPLLPHLPGFAPGVALVGVLGFANGVFGVTLAVWTQESLPPARRARVFALRAGLMGLAATAGSWGAGWLAARAGLEAAAAAAGLLALVAAAAAGAPAR
ncbi:MAG: hypothetical protein OWV35_03160, partial [Firmicutes bacterium]|nr:hypothetical protein [Bacillota bacterium]